MLEHLTDEELSKLEKLYQEYPLKQNLKRRSDAVEYGYSTKFAYHVVRLLNEVEQILVEGDLDLQRNNEQLKSIRRGEWTLEQLEAWFVNKEKILETTYANCSLPHSPDEEKIKGLLMNCLEMHYGSLGSAVVRVPQLDQLVNDLSALVDRYCVK